MIADRQKFEEMIGKVIPLSNADGLAADVVAWLRKKGKGYQTRANALLREAMLRHLRRKAS